MSQKNESRDFGQTPEILVPYPRGVEDYGVAFLVCEQLENRLARPGLVEIANAEKSPPPEIRRVEQGFAPSRSVGTTIQTRPATDIDFGWPYGWAIEIAFCDVKEVVGAGKQQVRFSHSSVGAFHICLCTYVMAEA